MHLRTLNDGIVASSRQLAAALLAGLGLLASGCGSDSKEGNEAADSPSGCVGGALEADLEAPPLSGPGVDPGTGEVRPRPDGSSYVVSTTYGIPRSGDDVRERYLQYFGAIQEQLASQPGLVALQLGLSASCGSGRTLAVWESSEAMYDFVMSPAHLAAMDAADELLEPGYGVTHWETADPGEISFAEGARRIKAASAR
ncbi:hypothetical protein SOCEGT47_059560 [Sorangium cellulosum]|uniref:Uncharacterized protein n=2 Tax=Sorangium cellulosum TaxID=56 RepID=A0A4P2Q7F7_SORCE|nr:hypothetical protein SOCEGT47_059560 [Sorangium cellulosum]